MQFSSTAIYVFVCLHLFVTINCFSFQPSLDFLYGMQNKFSQRLGTAVFKILCPTSMETEVSLGCYIFLKSLISALTFAMNCSMNYLHVASG
jgi:hypothetical protein